MTSVTERGTHPRSEAARPVHVEPPAAGRLSALRPWLERAVVLGAVAALGAGLALRFVAKSDMWLDEALTVNIARLPLSQFHAALREDGAPPLYYLLLHFWMGVFGTSNEAVRALSGVLSCATLPFVWVAGRRIGGRSVGAAALLIVASSPFAIYYATENRMYALVAFLTAAGVVALQRALSRPTGWNLVAVGAVSALLLYTHYWSIYLLGVVLVWLLFRARRSSEETRRRPARLCAVAVFVGGLAFVPWLPTFFFQIRHTGTPWAEPANFAAMVNAIASFAGGATSQGRALALLYFAFAGLGLFGVARSARHIDLDLHTRPPARALAIALGGTLAAAIVGGYLTSSAFQARYASVVFVPLILLVALGLSTFADRRIRTVLVAATIVFGFVGAVPNISIGRTQAAQVARALQRAARPGDIVAFCPDQIGPSVNRLVPANRYQMISFPRGTSPVLVNWINYAHASHEGNPAQFARRLEKMSAPDHQIWLVWAPGYQTFGTKCERLETDLLADRNLGAAEVFPYKEVDNPFSPYEEMELVQFAHQPG